MAGLKAMLTLNMVRSLRLETFSKRNHTKSPKVPNGKNRRQNIKPELGSPRPMLQSKREQNNAKKHKKEILALAKYPLECGF
jgi:hypothetical protein